MTGLHQDTDENNLDAIISTQQQAVVQQPPPDTLFVWDFDSTVVNCNSDEYIPGQYLSSPNVHQQLMDLYNSNGGDWHASVEGVVNALLENNGLATPTTLLEAAAQMPYLTGVRQALDMIHQQHPSTQQMILSDGNTLFIHAFLDKEHLSKHFCHVISNPGEFVDDDNNKKRLRVTHQSTAYGGHSCHRCAANLCKSQALQETLSSSFKTRPKRIVYVGDGANDACPVLNVLKQNNCDVLLARVGTKRPHANQRKGPETDLEAEETTTTTSDETSTNVVFGIIPALERAAKDQQSVVPTCQVLEWRTGDELRQLVETILSKDDIA